MPEVNPRFKGKPEKKPSAASKELAWKKAVRERDQFHCQWPNCRVVNKSIHAHHIATRKQRPDLKYEISNGVSLCFLHHQLAHDDQALGERFGFVSHERYEKVRNQRP